MNINGVVIVNSLGKIRYINKNLKRIIGDINYGNVTDILKIKDGNNKSFMDIVKNNYDMKLKLYIVDNNGEEISVTGTTDAIEEYDEKYYIIQLQSDEEEELKREIIEMELKLFFGTTIELMAIINEDLQFEMVNDRWTTVLGWSKEELLNMDIFKTLNGDDEECLSKRMDILKGGKGSIKYRNRYRAKNGEIKDLEWESRYIKDIGKYICVGTDITENVMMKNNNEKYEKQLEQEKLKSEIFSNVSHEFKTPLNIISSAIQLIDAKISSAKECADAVVVKEYVDSIKRNCYRLIKMVNNVVDISRIDAGYYKINRENKNIVSVIEDITMSVVVYAKDKGRKIVFDTEEEEIITAIDSEKIERVMLNLLSNSIRHTEENGNINVYICRVGEDVKVSVEDDGCGIPKDKIDNIFTRFIQVDNAAGDHGSGIGLALVKSIVEMHGGRVWVESKVNCGSRFIFTLPIKVIEKDNNNINTKEKSYKISSNEEKCFVELSDI